MNESKINKHLVVTDAEWRCLINALDVLEIIVKGDQLDSDIISDLRRCFPPVTIENAQSKLSNFWS